MKLPFKSDTICFWLTVVKKQRPKTACSYLVHNLCTKCTNFILGDGGWGVFIKSLMKIGGRRWRWTSGLTMRATNFSSCGKSYHPLQDVYYFLGPDLLLSVAQFRAMEGNVNYATCIQIFSGQILFTTVFWLLHIKLA